MTESVSIHSSHGELKRRIVNLVGGDPSRYASGIGVERHRRLTAAEIDMISEAFGMRLANEPKQQTMDAIMIRLGRDHRTGASTWDASDLVAVVDALEEADR